jgi:nucleoside-diphosphate-sugar epimerase
MVRLGDGTARFGHVYVTNVVHAHRLAAQALQANQASGQCYFIGDHPPTNFFDFFTPFLQTLGYSPASRTISKRLAWVLAVLSEALGRAGIGPQPPLLTRYVVASTCEDFFFSHAKAGRELGYRPIISYEQALAETIAALRESPALTG